MESPTKKAKRTAAESASAVASPPAAAPTATAAGNSSAAPSASAPVAVVDIERDYFGSYEWSDIHELMLRDTARTEAYRRAIAANAAHFRDAVVMDVGCGTGILSLFAARAGARRVYAVEASGMAVHARAVVARNGLSDVITVVQSKVEDITALPDPKYPAVDIIISEWMGYFLTYEGMLESVITARDRFLKPASARAPGWSSPLYPSVARVYVSAFAEPDPSDAERAERAAQLARSVAFWSAPQYGFDLSPLVPVVQRAARDADDPQSATALAPVRVADEPIVELIGGEQLLGARGECVRTYDLAAVIIADLRSAPTVTASAAGTSSGAFRQPIIRAGTAVGFAAWFDVEFPSATSAAAAPASATALPTASSATAAPPAPALSLKEQALAAIARKRKLADAASASASAPVVLSTGPDTTPTHWCQTLFPIERPFAVKQGDVVCGALTACASAVNPRFVDITLAHTPPPSSLIALNSSPAVATASATGACSSANAAAPLSVTRRYTLK